MKGTCRGLQFCIRGYFGNFEFMFVPPKVPSGAVQIVSHKQRFKQKLFGRFSIDFLSDLVAHFG